MCYIEYDWTCDVWKFRIGDTFTDFQGRRSWKSFRDAKAFFTTRNFTLIKTDTRTWRVTAKET
jgi:hypothetical protein